jgi:hypothetical protein
MPKSAYGAKGSKDSHSGQRGNVGISSGAKNGSKGGDMFFKDRTMQNNEGVGKKSTIQRRQPS